MVKNRRRTDNPVVLITGAGIRIGAETARILHAAGASVVLHYHTSSAAAETLAAGLNHQRAGSALALRGNLLQPGEPETLVEKATAYYGRLDGLVNNASIFYPTPVGHINEEAWHDLIGTNLKAPLFLAQAAAPWLRQKRGMIVNMTDIHAQRPLQHYTLYCTAKAGLLGLTYALALDLAPEIRVNAIAPGAIAWPGDGSYSPEQQQTVIDSTLLKRVGSMTDIAKTIRFLMFDAPYITGQVIAVDGGRSLAL